MKARATITATVLVGALVLASALHGAWPRARLTREQYLAAMNGALDEIVEKERGLPKHPLLFSGNLFLAHGAFIPYFPLDALEAYADALKDAGADRIDINPGLSPWLELSAPKAAAAVAKYDALTAHIRKLGLQLALNPEYNAGDLKISDFGQWQDAALKAYSEMARRYRPDIFVVVHEPTTMAARLKLRATAAQWREFARALARAVKRESPNTRIGTGVLWTEVEYFSEFVSIPEVDVVSLDIYQLKGLKTFNEMIAKARRAGKPVYIEETWRPPYYVPQFAKPLTLENYASTGIGDSAFEALDSKWLTAIALYASGMGLEAITPFWTQTFFKYTEGDGFAIGYEYNLTAAQALQNGERTATFRTYQRLRRELGRP